MLRFVEAEETLKKRTNIRTWILNFAAKRPRGNLCTIYIEIKVTVQFISLVHTKKPFLGQPAHANLASCG